MLSSVCLFVLDPLVDFDFIIWFILTNCCDVLVEFDKWQIRIRKIRPLAEAVENCRFVQQDHRSVPVTVTNLDTFRSIVCHFDTLYLYLSHACVNLRKLPVSRRDTIELKRQQNNVPTDRIRGQRESKGKAWCYEISSWHLVESGGGDVHSSPSSCHHQLAV